MSNSKKETDILLNKWLRYSKSNKSLISKEELVNKFIYYAQEVNNYTF